MFAPTLSALAAGVGGTRKEHGLLYNAYEMQRQMLVGASNWAAIGAKMLNNPALPMGYFGMGPVVASATVPSKRCRPSS